jgi:hypothetical protein
MSRDSKKPKTYAITSETFFEDFESLSLIDAGSTDGFQIKGDGADSQWIFIPTGVPYNIGQSGGRIMTRIYIKEADGGTLNVSATVVY